ncbi:MAG: UDP-N-acetylglucosamine 2-epimerase (non-hydrolyzing) [Deltaproteobacteria bacterium]|nr:UDP-N-acetylglucosamine 2-epimerase (non-hydrolyzing) [Deltaproteobacteria bacterium]
MKLIIVMGARPNFIKVAPLVEAFKRAQSSHPHLEILLVHTGQHYDAYMSGAFFHDLGIPVPDIDLEVGSGSHAEQTGRVMIAFERLLLERKPRWVIVVGDVNSTMACALTAKKLGIKVAHVEAGLRSHDWTMPEEINRVVTDVLCDVLFTTETAGSDNLMREGIDRAKIHFVGNVMIDTLLKHRERAQSLAYWSRIGLAAENYAVLTLHRPSNVDEPASFTRIVDALDQIAPRLAIVFPAHPRTRKMAQQFGLWERIASLPNLHLLEPLGYLEMLSLTSSAKIILTDSGGLQEEAVALGVPCLTLRDNTERPVTIEVGANRLVGNDSATIIEAVNNLISNRPHRISLPDKWDGRAAERIAQTLLSLP